MDGPAVIEVVLRGELRVSFESFLDQIFAFSSGDEKERRIFEFATDDAPDSFFPEEGVRTGFVIGIFIETDPPCFDGFFREDPVEAIEGAFRIDAVVSHGVHDRLDGCRFGRSVGTMKEDETVGLTVAGELPQLVVNSIIDRFLGNQ